MNIHASEVKTGDILRRENGRIERATRYEAHPTENKARIWYQVEQPGFSQSPIRGLWRWVMPDDLIEVERA